MHNYYFSFFLKKSSNYFFSVPMLAFARNRTFSTPRPLIHAVFGLAMVIVCIVLAVRAVSLRKEYDERTTYACHVESVASLGIERNSGKVNTVYNTHVTVTSPGDLFGRSQICSISVVCWAYTDTRYMTSCDTPGPVPQDIACYTTGGSSDILCAEPDEAWITVMIVAIVFGVMALCAAGSFAHARSRLKKSSMQPVQATVIPYQQPVVAHVVGQSLDPMQGQVIYTDPLYYRNARAPPKDVQIY
jgi:hypothetical protein